MVVISYGRTSFNLPEYCLDHFNDETIEGLINIGEVSPRILSSKMRFRLFNILYVCALLILYSGLILVWPSISGFLNIQNSNPVLTNIMVAMVISGLLPYLPFIEKLMTGTKEFLHNQAQIPSKARNIYALLRDNAIRDDKLIPLSHTYDRVLFSQDFFDFKSSTSKLYFPRIWLRYCYLFDELTKNEWRELIIDNVDLVAFSLAQIRIQHTFLMKEVKEESNKENSDYSDIKIKIMKQLKLIYTLITCSLIDKRKSFSDSKKIMEKMGFEVKQTSVEKFAKFNNVLIHTSILLFVIASSCFIFFMAKTNIPELFAPNSFKEYGNPVHATLVWLIYSAFMFGLALLIAYYGRYFLSRSEIWRKVTFDKYYMNIRNRPWNIYLLLSLISYVVTTIIFRIIYFFIPAQSLEMGIELYLWPLIPALTTLFVCYRFDSIKFNPISGLKQEPIWKSSVVQGSVMLIASYFIMEMTNLVQQQVKFNQGDFILILSTNFLIGFFNSLSMGFLEIERRNNSRLCLKKVREKISIVLPDKESKCIIRDISETGAKLYSPDPLYLKGQETIEIKYILDGLSFLFCGRIIENNKNFLRLKMIKSEGWQDTYNYIKKRVSNQTDSNINLSAA